METTIHPQTGAVLTRGVRPRTSRYKGEEITYDMPGWYPQDDGDSIHTGVDMAVSDRHLTILKARVAGLPEPATVKRIRKRLKLTQREASELFGGGANAFQKYESGEVLVSRAVANLLTLLDGHPDNVAILRQATAARAAVTRQVHAGASTKVDKRAREEASA